jgi:hypothetical protein
MQLIISTSNSEFGPFGFISRLSLPLLLCPVVLPESEAGGSITKCDKVEVNVKIEHRLYDLAIISYILALGHFVLEFIVFQTAGLGPGLISPLIVASTSLIWMISRELFLVSFVLSL